MDPDDVQRLLRGTDGETVLLRLHDHGDELDWTTLESVVGDVSRIHEGIQDLGRFELIDPTRIDYDRVALNGKGVRMAERIAHSRRDGPDRWDAVQRSILRWLAAQQQPYVNLSFDFGRSGDAQSATPAYSAHEITHATDYLELVALITCRRSASGLVRAKISPQGRYALHQAGLISQFVRSPSGTSIDNSTNTTIGDGNTLGAVATGAGNVQQVTQTLTASDREKLSNAAGEILRTLDATPGTMALREAISRLQADSADQTATTAGLRDKIVEAVVIAGATAGAQTALQELAQLLGALPRARSARFADPLTP